MSPLGITTFWLNSFIIGDDFYECLGRAPDRWLVRSSIYLEQGDYWTILSAPSMSFSGPKHPDTCGFFISLLEVNLIYLIQKLQDFFFCVSGRKDDEHDFSSCEAVAQWRYGTVRRKRSGLLDDATLFDIFLWRIEERPNPYQNKNERPIYSEVLFFWSDHSARLFLLDFPFLWLRGQSSVDDRK